PDSPIEGGESGSATPDRSRPARKAGPGEPPGGQATLAVDIGGTGIKASVLDPKGAMMVDRVRVKTPHPCPPDLLVEAISALAEGLPPFDRVSVGFPGMVRRDRVITAPNLSTCG